MDLTELVHFGILSGLNLQTFDILGKCFLESVRTILYN